MWRIKYIHYVIKIVTNIAKLNPINVCTFCEGLIIIILIGLKCT